MSLMVRPRIYKTEAIVLKRAPLGETDAILTLYTPHYGRIRVVAKGVRKTRSKLGGHVEPLTRGAFVLAQGRNLDIVTQAQGHEMYVSLRSDIWRTACAFYVAELLDQYTGEHIENPELYDIVDGVLRWVGEGRPELALRYFELQLLRCLGYQPELHECTECRSKLHPGTNLFSIAEGGVLCAECGRSGAAVCSVSDDALKVMRFYLENEGTSARRLRVGGDLSLELERLLRSYMRYVLEGDIRSAGFLDTLRMQGAPG